MALMDKNTIPYAVHSECIWFMNVSLKRKEKLVGRWHSVTWELDELFPSDGSVCDNYQLVPLTLYCDERASYRLNLDMDKPLLYLVCDEDPKGDWFPVSLSADQNVAASCLEGDTPVLSFAMPDAIACWIEAFITRHGEVTISAHRRKHVNRRQELACDKRRKNS